MTGDWFKVRNHQVEIPALGLASQRANTAGGSRRMDQIPQDRLAVAHAMTLRFEVGDQFPGSAGMPRAFAVDTVEDVRHAWT
ncbi:MAG TPA: hypothetical protein VE083_12880 [Terriglobales bacterium]|nr:hypothetical protein [Terriglobales bacterium]